MWSSKPFLRAKHLATTVQFSLYLNLLNLKLPPFPDTYGYRMLLTLIFYAKNVTLLIGTLFTMMTSTNGSNISQQQYSTSANVSHEPKWITNEIKRLIRKRKRLYRKATQSFRHAEIQKATK